MNTNLAYREERRSELIDGQPAAMPPSPVWNHNRAAFNIAHIFENYLYGKKCIPISDGTDLHLTERDIFIPDMMVVCDPSKIKWNGVYGAPDLVVEVLSPSTAKNDRGHKKKLYEKSRVKEYWIVNANEKTIEQYLLADSQLELHAVYTLYPDYVLEAMTDDERAAVVTEFQCSLFSGLTIRLADVFYRTI